MGDGTGMALESGSSLDRLVEATPDSRDRYVDFLRAFSIAVVVLGHWMIAVVHERDGRITGENALDLIPGLWAATWLLQVMPIFFFVGGFSNLVTLRALRRRGQGTAEFRQGRLARLLRPTVVFLGVWAVAGPLLWTVPFVPRSALGLAFWLVIGPLWFLAVYLLLVLLTPRMAALHERYGIRIPLAVGAGAAAVDLIRLHLGHEWVGLANILLVWLFVHQLGFFYADGSLGRGGKPLFLGMMAAGLAGLLLLTRLGVYPVSMVGRASDDLSNMAPPTLPMLALSVWQVGLAMLLREPLKRWLGRRLVWKAVIGANGVIMTVFLWHLTAMLVVIAVVLPLGFPQPPAGSAAWWALRPAWMALLLLALGGLVVIFGRLERPRLPAAADRYWDFTDFYTL